MKENKAETWVIEGETFSGDERVASITRRLREIQAIESRYRDARTIKAEKKDQDGNVVLTIRLDKLGAIIFTNGKVSENINQENNYHKKKSIYPIIGYLIGIALFIGSAINLFIEAFRD